MCPSNTGLSQGAGCTGAWARPLPGPPSAPVPKPGLQHGVGFLGLVGRAPRPAAIQCTHRSGITVGAPHASPLATQKQQHGVSLADNSWRLRQHGCDRRCELHRARAALEVCNRVILWTLNAGMDAHMLSEGGRVWSWAVQVIGRGPPAR